MIKATGTKNLLEVPAYVEALQRMQARLRKGDGVYTTCEIHPDIPTMNDIGDKPGHRLKSIIPIEHVGFGLMRGVAPNFATFHFDAGSTFLRSVKDEDGNYLFSWGLITSKSGSSLEDYFALLESVGYDVDKAHAAIQELLGRAP